MLDRVAMNQSVLRLPGLGVDEKGVAFGSKGVALFASLDRVIAFLSFFTSSRSMADIIPSLRIEVVNSKKLNVQDFVVSFVSDSTDRMDCISESARATLGQTFIGTDRHFVQYRDAASPFGYDTPDVLSVDADYVFYHNTLGTTAYGTTRSLNTRGLILSLHLAHDPKFGREPGPCFILADNGVGPAIIEYFIRSNVAAQVGVVELPPTLLERRVVRQYLFSVDNLPSRMWPMLHGTPGITVFGEVTRGVAVQHGFRHPIALAAFPVFSTEGLVLFRGDMLEPIELKTLPAMGDVSAFAKVAFGPSDASASITCQNAIAPPVTVPIRLLPGIEYSGNICAAFVPVADYPILRQVMYRLGASVLRTASIAFTEHGGFLINPSGIGSTPVGLFMREIRSGLFIIAGYDIAPPIEPEALFRLLGSPAKHNIFMLPNQLVVGIQKSDFKPIQTALIQSDVWIPVDRLSFDSAFSDATVEVKFDRNDLAKRA